MQKSPRMVPGLDLACKLSNINTQFPICVLLPLTGSVSPSICLPVATTPSPSHTWQTTENHHIDKKFTMGVVEYKQLQRCHNSCCMDYEAKSHFGAPKLVHKNLS